MWKCTVTLAGVTTLLAACSGSAPTGPRVPTAQDAAPSFARTAPGDPGEPNCHGLTAAFVTQEGPFAGLVEGRGLGTIARAADGSVGDIHALIRNYCTLFEPPPT
jgi:hypothetical protein